MSRRQEVFQAKVLQKLYPAAPTVEKQPSPPRLVDALSRKKHARRIASNQDAASVGATASQGRRMYTVLPPPADYKPHSEDSVTPSQLESINSAEDPAEDDVNEEPDEEEEEEEEQKRRRRRRKRKAAPQQDCGKDAAASACESSTGQTPVAEEGQNISKNKRRKLKKKRHKQKLLDMGLMPRATALEFTYRKDEEEEEEEEEEEDYEKKAAEVSDFLKTTMEIYMSDSSLHMADHPVLSETVTDLLSGLAGGQRSTSVLGLLCRLKAFVQQRQTDALEKALEELLITSPMSAGETTAVTSLFRYWITQIFPVQGDKKTGLSTGPL